MMEQNWDRVAELFRKEFPKHKDVPGPFFEIIKEFIAFRLGYYLGGADALVELPAEMEGKNVVRGK